MHALSIFLPTLTKYLIKKKNLKRESANFVLRFKGMRSIRGQRGQGGGRGAAGAVTTGYIVLAANIKWRGQLGNLETCPY